MHIGSVLAFRLKTGELVWAYQFSPNDPFDYDATELGMLVDMKIGGANRKPQTANRKPQSAGTGQSQWFLLCA